MSLREELLAEIEQEKETKLALYRKQNKTKYANTRETQLNSQHKNKDHHSKIAKDRRQKYKQQLVQKFNNECYDCHTTYPSYVYDFHHLDPNNKMEKKLAIRMPNSSYEKMLTWVDGCVMLCSNCHRIRHHAEKE